MLEPQTKRSVRGETVLESKRTGFLATVLRQKPQPLEAPRVYGEAPPNKRGSRNLLLVLLGLSPALLGLLYLTAFSSDRYVSTASFVVRTASKPLGSAGGLGSVLQMVGLSRADDDAFSVQDFLRSREAIDRLAKLMPVKDYFSHSGRDYLLAYPSFWYGNTSEEFYRYTANFIDVSYNGSTGITTLTVQAFRPNDAYEMATALLSLAEDRVNDLNTRIRLDAIRVAESEVDGAKSRLSNAMVELTQFRNRELMIDPNKNSAMLGELIGRLGSDLAETETRASEMESSSPKEPGLAELRGQAAALQQQIDAERSKITGASTGLAEKLATYERMTLDRDFAKAALDRALNALDSARAEARRRQLFLEKVVNPNLPDASAMPRRLWSFFTISALNLVALMVLWLLTTGLREHSVHSD